MQARLWLIRLWLAAQLSRLVSWLNPQAGKVTESAIEAIAAELRAVRAERDEVNAQIGVLTDRHADLRQQHQLLEGMHGSLESELAALKAEYANYLPFKRDAMFARAVALVKQWDAHETSGEFKRHQVLASLMDDFPGRPRRELALAIEAAIWQ